MDENVAGAECGETATSGNVRVKISAWLSGIVDEVRRKRSTPLQQWVDRVPESTKSDISKEENHSEETDCRNQEIRSIVRKLSDDKEKNPKHPLVDGNNANNFWTKANVLNRLNRNTDSCKEKKDENNTVSNLKALGRAKIYEFYDRVRINKERYDLMKLKKSNTSGLNKSENMAKNQQTDLEESELENHQTTMFHLDEHLNIDEADVETESETARHKIRIAEVEAALEAEADGSLVGAELATGADAETDLELGNLNVVNQKVTIGGIGHSMTIETNPVASIGCIVKSTPPKNISIGYIGRSFSEQNDDDEDDSFLLNERSRSYSQVINDRNNSRHIDDNNVCSSLPSFFGNKSLSIANSKIMSRGASFSESPRRSILLRDSSVQSDSSHCSSVESLLEARKPDPEAILINLGFGPVESDDVLSKIPKRFLKPSQVKGIDTEAFLRQQQLANNIYDNSVLGYRGLIGTPHSQPSMIVAKIMERFELNERNRCVIDIGMNRPQSAPPTPAPNP